MVICEYYADLNSAESRSTWPVFGSLVHRQHTSQTFGEQRKTFYVRLWKYFSNLLFWVNLNKLWDGDNTYIGGSLLDALIHRGRSTFRNQTHKLSWNRKIQRKTNILAGDRLALWIYASRSNANQTTIGWVRQRELDGERISASYLCHLRASSEPPQRSRFKPQGNLFSTEMAH